MYSPLEVQEARTSEPNVRRERTLSAWPAEPASGSIASRRSVPLGCAARKPLVPPQQAHRSELAAEAKKAPRSVGALLARPLPSSYGMLKHSNPTIDSFSMLE